LGEKDRNRRRRVSADYTDDADFEKRQERIRVVGEALRNGKRGSELLGKLSPTFFLLFSPFLLRVLRALCVEYLLCFAFFFLLICEICEIPGPWGCG